jgi:hypothetical protein
LARARISAYDPFLGGFAGPTGDAIAAPVPWDELGALTLALVDAVTLCVGFDTVVLVGFFICVMVVAELVAG